METIHIGPAGWHYEDWKGIVYPYPAQKGFSELAYLAQYFNTLEINSSFYRIPQPRHVQSWITQVKFNAGFLFTIKLWQGFTHQTPVADGAALSRFRAGLDVLAVEHRLGALLIQFPWRFKRTAANVEYVLRCAGQLQEYGPALEFRHESWNQVEWQQTLADRQLAWVNIDQPVIGSSIAPGQVVTSAIAYLRLHGRNYQNWFNETAGRDDRYNYLYSEAELAEWKSRIQSMAGRAQHTFVIFNNHFRGQAVVNSLQLSAALFARPMASPASLVQHYPGLRKIGPATQTGQTLDLFC